MKAKKTKKKKEITLQSEKSFDELIEDAFEDKVFKKGQLKTLAFLAASTVKKKTAKKSVKKTAKKAVKKKK